ncbi:MAG: mechanosensitive ion channel family protein [Candidatus Andersenbacteria bacterium]|nr:mechanosensitive ion channel family protein [Candidatus Andersenbacteria bacterium]MBI3250942.1 mechanosensitive ion channel family protein [Candidatus Andersenbacteria bacterium]
MALLEGAFWEAEVWGNTLNDYTLALILFVVALVILKLVKFYIVNRVSKVIVRSRTHIDDALLEVFDTIRPPFYIFISFYGATRLLTLEGQPEKVMNVILLLWVTWQVVATLQIFIDYLIQTRLAGAQDVARKAISGIVSGLAKIVLWSVALLFVLSNLGVDVTSLLAGIGIGGLAIALGARSLLEDLFSSLAIVFDRPFAPGDFIEVAGEKGTVQKVGVKTTRIKSLSGEEVIIPNRDLASSRIRNYRHMQERRVTFQISVDPTLSRQKLEQIPVLVAGAMDGHGRFKWCRVISLAKDKTTFDVAYFVGTYDYSDYLDTHEKVLLAIREAFENEGIHLA